MKIKTIISVTMLCQVLSYGDSPDMIKNSFTKGDVLKLESCDKYEWCKVSNTKFYVKGYFFEASGNSLYKKRSNVETFLYVKNKHSNEYVRYSAPNNKIDHRAELNAFIYNQKNGYTRINFTEDKKIQIISDSKKEVVTHVQKAVPLAVVEEKKVIETIAPKEVSSRQGTSFVYGALGLSAIDPTENSPLLTTNNLDKRAPLIDVGLGYHYNNNIFTTLSVSKASFKEIDISNVYVSGNYQFTDTVLNPYIGMMLGYSQLSWTKDPIDNAINIDSKSSNLLVGLQVGLEQKINDKFSIFTQYQLIHGDHITYINDDKLKHSYQNNLLTGLKYDF